MVIYLQKCCVGLLWLICFSKCSVGLIGIIYLQKCTVEFLEIMCLQKCSVVLLGMMFSNLKKQCELTQREVLDAVLHVPIEGELLLDDVDQTRQGLLVMHGIA